MLRYVKTMLLLFGMVAGTAALADGLQNLPPKLMLPQTGESPGVVTFDHGTHVDAAKPAATCTSCHPKLFGILGRSASSKRAPVTHAAMEKGNACGACHGKAAFGMDDCTMCHAQ